MSLERIGLLKVVSTFWLTQRRYVLAQKISGQDRRATEWKGRATSAKSADERRRALEAMARRLDTSADYRAELTDVEAQLAARLPGPLPPIDQRRLDLKMWTEERQAARMRVAQLQDGRPTSTLPLVLRLTRLEDEVVRVKEYDEKINRLLEELRAGVWDGVEARP